MKRLQWVLSLLAAGATVLSGCLAPLDSPASPRTAGDARSLSDAIDSSSSQACPELPSSPLHPIPGSVYAPGLSCEQVAPRIPGPLNEILDASGIRVSLPSFTNSVVTGATIAGEPTIGVTPAGNLYFKANTRTFKSANSGSSWSEVFAFPAELHTFDPMMWVDTTTGRIFLNHLYVGCSRLWYSDNEGSTWTFQPAACGTPGNDHQKVVSGPYHAGSVLGPTLVYANAVYYCYNAVAYTGCSLSQTGGLTWNPATVADTMAKCGGLAGHPHVASDGTLYVPVSFCVTHPFTNLFGDFYHGVLVSENNGLTFVRRDTSATGLIAATADLETLEPDVATTPDGTVYMAGSVHSGTDNLPYAFVSADKGATWSTVNLAGATGVVNTAFPVATAGIDGRAAVAFLGSTTTGNPSTLPSSAVWNLYVSFTYDAGSTWTTVQASPSGNPVQRGCIWLLGGSSPCRNLLDFMDATIDLSGNVLVGYADGCVSATCTGSGGTASDSRARQGTVAVQTTGTPLL